jgi:hypothetical protein
MEERAAGAREANPVVEDERRPVVVDNLVKRFAEWKLNDIDVGAASQDRTLRADVAVDSPQKSGSSDSSDSDKEHVCDNPHCPALCHTEGAGHCSSCHHAYYCSRECQKIAWPEHKAECGGMGMDVVGSSVVSNYFPDAEMSNAARILRPTSMEEHSRNKNLRRKKLLLIIKTLKLLISDRQVEMRLVGADKRAVLCGQICAAMHKVAACFLYLGQGADAKRYMQRAEKMHGIIMSQHNAGDTVPLFEDGWQNLPSFLGFVEFENKISSLKKRMDREEDMTLGMQSTSELIELMDKKLVFAKGVLTIVGLVELLLEMWAYSIHMDVVYRSIRDKPEYLRDAINSTVGVRLLASHAQACRKIIEYMEFGEELRSLVFTPDKHVYTIVRRWCANELCDILHSSEQNSGRITCPGCDSCFYCSDACKTTHWPQHEVVCVKMRSVGLGVCMFLNDDVQTARYADASGSALDVLHKQLHEQLVSKMIEMTTASGQGRVNVHLRRLEAIQIIVAATQIMVLMGHSIRAYEQLEQCAKLFDCKEGLEDLQQAGNDATSNLEERYTQLQEVVADLRLNVEYYMRETMFVRLLHARQTATEQWKQVLVYAHVFEELEYQVKWTKFHNMHVREFFARFLVWREGKRFRVHGDARTDSFHDIFIEKTLSSLPTAHEECDRLYQGYMTSIDVKRSQDKDISAEQELAKMMLVNLEMMRGTRKRSRGEVVRLIF